MIPFLFSHVLLLLCCSQYLFCEPQSPLTWKGRMPCCIYTTEGRCPGKSVWLRVNRPKAVSPQCWAEHSRLLSLCFLQTHLAIPAFLCKTHHSNWSLWSFPGLSTLYSLLDFAFSCSHTLHLSLPSLPIEILCTWKDPFPFLYNDSTDCLNQGCCFHLAGLV